MHKFENGHHVAEEQNDVVSTLFATISARLFHAKASFDYKLVFRCRGVLIHLSTVLVKILVSIMESRLLHLPYTNHLKLKNLLYLIALFR
jgi:hypothetical protein